MPYPHYYPPPIIITPVNDACTDTGRLMARYCIAFESMKRFMALKGNEGLAELVRPCVFTDCWGVGDSTLDHVQVGEMALCREFEDVHLRANEKKVLNTLNKDKNRPTIRWLLSLTQLPPRLYVLVVTTLLTHTGFRWMGRWNQPTWKSTGEWHTHDGCTQLYQVLPCILVSFKPAWAACLFRSLPSTKTHRYAHHACRQIHLANISHANLPFLHRKSSDLRPGYVNVQISLAVVSVPFLPTQGSLPRYLPAPGLMELQLLGTNFNSLLNAVILHKCIQARCVIV